jgi:hypothetical protein
MFSKIRKRLTYANVAMTLALVFAMSGGAYAASKYVITSTKQISPKVLKSLKGKAGANGAQGPAGAAGAAGPQGAAGAAGAKGEVGATGAAGTNGTNGTNGKDGTTGFTETLPAGKTEKGEWTAVGHANGEGELVVGSASINIPLAAAPVARYVNKGGQELTASGEQPPVVCMGSAANPTAPAGTLCVYAGAEGGGTAFGNVLNGFLLGIGWEWGTAVTTGDGSNVPNTALAFGFAVPVVPAAAEYINHAGTWAVTG